MVFQLTFKWNFYIYVFLAKELDHRVKDIHTVIVAKNKIIFGNSIVDGNFRGRDPKCI